MLQWFRNCCCASEWNPWGKAPNLAVSRQATEAGHGCTAITIPGTHLFTWNIVKPMLASREAVSVHGPTVFSIDFGSRATEILPNHPHRQPPPGLTKTLTVLRSAIEDLHQTTSYNKQSSVSSLVEIAAFLYSLSLQGEVNATCKALWRLSGHYRAAHGPGILRYGYGVSWSVLTAWLAQLIMLDDTMVRKE